MSMQYDQETKIVNGEISLPIVHDAALTGISVVSIARDYVALCLMSEREEFVSEIFFPGVKRMRFDTFLKGNIIFDITVGRVEDLNGKDLAWLSGVSDFSESQVENELALLANLRTITLSASYGCGGIAVLDSAPEAWRFSSRRRTQC